MTTVATRPVASPLGVAKLMARDIKLSHSIFALPFAALGAFLARTGDWPGNTRFAGMLSLIVVCMVCARTWAMVFNRLADRSIDAANPRTQRRVLASGQLSTAQGWAAAALAAGLFLAATSLFWVFFGNRWPLLLSAPVLAWIAFYSLTKRFTALCHIFLGGALAASPVAAAIAIDPSTVILPLWPPSIPAIWLLAGMVLCWVAGFDVIYALQDVEFDRGAGLHSIPARLGVGGAMWASRGLHMLAFGFLVLAWLMDGRLSWIFGVGVGLVGGLLILEHAILAKRGKAGLDMAFFAVNGVVSCVLGVAGCVDILVL
jgi:4-hydroxybenzoate polyprenyltransferase